MGKKRKATSRGVKEPDGPNLDVGSSRKRITTFADVADSDDEFHINQDRIQLGEEPDAKRRRKWQEQEEFLQPSDEEVLDYSTGESEEEDNEGQQSTANERAHASTDDGTDDDDDAEEDGLRWGTAKNDMYGADEIETEEQALEEEAEALRLQKKQLESMAAADYGFDEEEWRDGDAAAATDKARGKVVTETLPHLHIGDDMGPAERLKLLRSRYPEFDPLSKELLQVQEYKDSLEPNSQHRGTNDTQHSSVNLNAKLQASAAYTGALTMYFTLLSSPAAGGSGRDVTAMAATDLRDHPVMDLLVRCRDLWLRAKKLPADVELIHEPPLDQPVQPNGNTTGNAHPTRPTNSHIKKSRAQRHAEAAQMAAEARKAERMQKVEADLMDLDGLLQSARRPNGARVKNDREDADSDVGDETILTAQEAAEKATRKKSLRFYTSQIAQKANKRGAAGRNAGGDDDIPYRERLKDRQERLNAEAAKRGQRNADPSVELGGGSDEEDDRQAQQIRADADQDDYYNVIASRTARRKADKAALAAAQKQAAAEGGRVVPEESVGPDGKRKITYAIEKNKGLTPHRKKEVGNPRVKKRKKFDEKKKKLGSVRAVYKGGEGRGGYGGELTGIKKGLVRSVKL